MVTILSICQLARAREEKVVIVSHSIATLGKQEMDKSIRTAKIRSTDLFWCVDYLRVSFFMQGIVNLRVDGTTPQQVNQWFEEKKEIIASPHD